MESKRLDLTSGPFIILAWIGPGCKQITPKTMSDLAEGGFNASLSSLSPDNMIRELDIAHDADRHLPCEGVTADGVKHFEEINRDLHLVPRVVTCVLQARHQDRLTGDVGAIMSLWC